jgi:hypothetical protein
MLVCNNCVLTENFPGIRFNEEGICNYCLDFKGREYQHRKRAEYSQKFEALLKEHRGMGCYDVLMCYSGGKDSTYTLAILKEKYGLNILALSFDNGFLPVQTLENIRTVVDYLGIDHDFFKPRFDVLAKLFRHCAENELYPPKYLERASAICTTCMGIIKHISLRLAIEKEIPFITYGWTPGQIPIPSSIMKYNPQMVKTTQKALYDLLFPIAGNEIEPYFLPDKYFSRSHSFPYNINPLAFLDYNVEEIYENISRFGWKRPADLDANSTNCLLNSFATFVHEQRLGFHPYATELASLVREGYIDRATALKKLEQPEDPQVVAMVKEKLSMGMESLG